MLFRFLILLLVFNPLTVMAQITDDHLHQTIPGLIDEAKKSYQDGDRTKALSSLEAAMNKIRSEKAQDIGIIFEKPIKGWRYIKQDGDSVTTSMPFLGGMSVLSGIYQSTDNTKKEIEVTIMADSPLVSSMLAMAQMAGQIESTQMRTFDINGYKAFVTTDDDLSEVAVIVGTTLVRLESIGMIDVSLKELAQIANNLDYKILDQ